MAIILARSGSRGVPGKNSADVGGRPCIAWTIGFAQGSSRIDRVVVSTDDGVCAAVARSMGVEVVERPVTLAHDTASIDDAARHAYGWVGAPDAPLAVLYANVPVRPAGLADEALGLLERSGCDSVQSFARVGKHHPWWTARADADGRLRAWEGDTLFHGCYRRQDLPEALVPDGGVMVVTPDALMCRVGAPEGPHAFLGVDRRAVITDEGNVIDIDTRTDLLVADAVLGERLAYADR